MQNLIIIIMMASIGYSQDIQAHAEHDKARFVANTGENKGSCNNRFRPCKTVTYAAQQANKGDKVLVAQGEYFVESEQDLLYLTGQVIPVLGGFNQVDQYQGQNPDTYLTVIAGVSAKYIEQLSQQGFHVIRDTKGLPQLVSQGKGLNTAHLQMMQQKQTDIPCVDGNADGFTCNNMSLLAHLPLSSFPSNPTSANDIWGHIDLNTNKEYAIIGLRNAIAVVDVTLPTQPEVVGSLSGLSSSWRDIKVYQYFDKAILRWQAYAYSTTEADEGLSIIDLNDLSNGISLVRRQTTDRTAHNIYISNIDYSLNIPLAEPEPRVHILGSNNFGGAFRSYTLADPETLGVTYNNTSATRNDYTHDASSLLINDSRAQTDCVVTNTHCSIMLDFNENSLRIWDHTNANQAEELSASIYPNAAYTHSGWWSEDKQYVIVHDELDEQTHSLNTTLNIFDISSLTSPVLVGTWTGPTRAIDHNGFVRGNRYYMSNYERGITVLDITDPATPIEAGFFDTYPVSDNASFNGAWGVYPFLPSGNILVSDINSGLYIIKDQSLQSGTGNISFGSQTPTVNEGQSFSLAVNKIGAGNTTVSYEVLPGSANSDDLNLASGELQWVTDDQASKNIVLTINSDSVDEVIESVFVRLFDPRNGATLISPSMIEVQILDSLQQGKIVFTTDEIVVKEIDGSIQVAVARQGGSDGTINISYSIASGSATLSRDVTANNGRLEWLNGDVTDKFININLINDSETEEQESLILTLSTNESNVLGNQSTLSLLIRDDESNQAPTASASQDFEVNTSQAVTLTGVGTDPEDQPITYLWQQVSGTNITINNTNSSQARFTAPSVAGNLEFSFTTTDDFGLTSSDNVVVTVVASTNQDSSTSSSGGGNLSILLLLSILTLAIRRKTGENYSIRTQ